MNFRLTSLLAPLGLLSCSTVFAATDNQPSVIDSSTITEAVGMLAVVLAVIVALGWFVKRYTVQGGGSNVNFDVLGMLRLGPREKLLLVRVGDSQVLLGVTANAINSLQVLPKELELSAPKNAEGEPVRRAGAFQDVLRNVLGKPRSIVMKVRAGTVWSICSLAVVWAAFALWIPESAQAALPVVTLSPAENGAQTYSLSLQMLALMTALTFLPAGVLMMTSFTRIIIVLAILRQALGTMNTPSNQVLLALFVHDVLHYGACHRGSAFRGGRSLPDEAISLESALENASTPVRSFMLRHTRQNDLIMFANMSGESSIASPEEVPFSVLLPAFVTSELKTAFQIGFLIFIPFLIIDLVVASILMGMGMVMLSPMVISFPFKIMLFVMVDGWALVMSTIAGSFYATQ